MVFYYEYILLRLESKICLIKKIIIACLCFILMYRLEVSAAGNRSLTTVLTFIKSLSIKIVGKVELIDFNFSRQSSIVATKLETAGSKNQPAPKHLK